MRVKVFLISNMFPSEQTPRYGVFVKNFKQQLEKNNVEFTECAFIIGKPCGVADKIAKYARLWFRIAWVGLTSKKFDIIYVHYPTTTAIPLLIISSLQKGKIMLNFHGTDLSRETKVNYFLLFFVKKLLKSTAQIIVPSKSFKQLALDKLKVSEDKIRVFPSAGIDIKKFNIRQSKSSSRKRVNLGFISRIETLKGWKVMLKACGRLLANGNNNFELIVVGEFIDTKVEFWKLISELNLEGHVQHLDSQPQENLPKLMSEMDVLVFPTLYYESLGLIGLEAMACGTPVIGSEIGGLKEYIFEGQNGYLFSPGDDMELYQKLDLFLNLNQQKRAELSKNARRTAQEYDSDKHTRSFSSFLNSFVKTD